jgi:hypothetical protein
MTKNEFLAKCQNDFVRAMCSRAWDEALLSVEPAQATGAMVPCPHHGRVEVIPGDIAEVCCHPDYSSWAQPE